MSHNHQKKKPDPNRLFTYYTPAEFLHYRALNRVLWNDCHLIYFPKFKAYLMEIEACPDCGEDQLFLCERPEYAMLLSAYQIQEMISKNVTISKQEVEVKSFESIYGRGVDVSMN